MADLLLTSDNAMGKSLLQAMQRSRAGQYLFVYQAKGLTYFTCYNIPDQASKRINHETGSPPPVIYYRLC